VPQVILLTLGRVQEGAWIGSVGSHGAGWALLPPKLTQTIPKYRATPVLCCCCVQALQLSHMKHLNDDSLAALVTAAQQIRALGLQEPGRWEVLPLLKCSR
jgi:hypothetical protein